MISGYTWTSVLGSVTQYGQRMRYAVVRKKAKISMVVSFRKLLYTPSILKHRGERKFKLFAATKLNEKICCHYRTVGHEKIFNLK